MVLCLHCPSSEHAQPRGRMLGCNWVADRFTALGYVVIAPALFDRIEAGFESGYSPEEVQGRKALCRQSTNAGLDVGRRCRPRGDR